MLIGVFCAISPQANKKGDVCVITSFWWRCKGNGRFVIQDKTWWQKKKNCTNEKLKIVTFATISSLNQKVSKHEARNHTFTKRSCFWQPPDHVLKWRIRKITDLNAPVLLRSTSRHQTLDVDASISHTGVYSSLLAKTKKDYKQVISQSDRLLYSVPWKPWKNTLTQHVGIQVTCYLLAFSV